MRRGGRWAGGNRPIVLGTEIVVRQNPVRLGQLRGAAGGHVLEFLAQMLDLVRMVPRDLQPERSLDLLARRGRRDLEEFVISLLRHPYFLNSATLAAGSSRRDSARASRSRSRLGAFFVVSVALCVQYGQKFQPGWSARWQCGQPPPMRLPHCGHARKSTPTALPHCAHSVRISLTSVTTRSSSSGVVMPAFTFARPSSPSEIIPPEIAASRI